MILLLKQRLKAKYDIAKFTSIISTPRLVEFICYRHNSFRIRTKLTITAKGVYYRNYSWSSRLQSWRPFHHQSLLPNPDELLVKIKGDLR